MVKFHFSLKAHPDKHKFKCPEILHMYLYEQVMDRTYLVITFVARRNRVSCWGGHVIAIMGPYDQVSGLDSGSEKLASLVVATTSWHLAGGLRL